MLGHIAGRNRQVDKHGVNRVAFELGKALQEAVAGDDVLECGCQITEIAVQQRFAGGAELDRYDFAGQIFRRGETAVRFHDQDLGVVIIGLGNIVSGFLHAVEDGHAGPDAVTLHGVELDQLLVPVHAEDFQLPAEQVADSLADFHVKAGVVSVVSEIAERGILRVNTHNKACSVGNGIFVCGKSSNAQRQQHRKSKCDRKNLFHICSPSGGFLLCYNTTLVK